jgi:hypothetical protein
LSAVARRASQIPFRVSFSFALAFLASQCAFSYARVFLRAARALKLSSDSKCALELEILRNSFSEARINAVDFESARFFGTFPKFARQTRISSKIAHPRSRLRNTTLVNKINKKK